MPPPPGAATTATATAARTGDAAALVAGLPTVTPSTPSGQPQAVTPQEVRQRRTPQVATAPTRRLEQGDLICGDCGEGNPPNRRFCSRCGASLVAAEKVHLPWWQRLFRTLFPRRRGRPIGAAGSAAEVAAARRRRQSPLKRILPVVRKAIALVMLVGGVVYATFAPVRELVNEQAGVAAAKAMSIIRPEYTQVHPLEVTGQGALRDHPPGAASDTFTNTFWAAPSAIQPSVSMRFDQPVEVTRALIRVGVSGNFQGTSRPHEMLLTYSNGKTQKLSLDDDPKEQQITLEPDGPVTAIDWKVTSLYRAGNSDTVAITEIELYRKK